MNTSDAVPIFGLNLVSTTLLPPSSDPGLGETASGNAVGSENRTGRRLLIRPEVLQMLQLTETQVQGIINTRQIIALRIAGEERFDSRDLERLIDTYKTTALRRAQ
jgi:hypothetical protein